MIYNLSSIDTDLSITTNIDSLKDIKEDVSAVIINYDLSLLKDLKRLKKTYKKIHVLVLVNNYVKDEHYNVLKYNFNYVQVNDNDDVKSVFKNLSIYEMNDDLVLDYKKKVAIYNDEVFKLTTKELLILNHLYSKKGIICSRTEILVDVLGYDKSGDKRIVDVYIKYLRNKIGNKIAIKTIRGEGYICT